VRRVRCSVICGKRYCTSSLTILHRREFFYWSAFGSEIMRIAVNWSINFCRRIIFAVASNASRRGNLGSRSFRLDNMTDIRSVCICIHRAVKQTIKIKNDRGDVIKSRHNGLINVT